MALDYTSVLPFPPDAAISFPKNDIQRRSSDVMVRFGFGRAVSRILSALLRAERIICLSSQYPGPIPLARNVERAAPRSPIWPCTRWGFPCLVTYASSGGLLHHLFTLTRVSCETRAVCFLWHCPSGRLAASAPACILKSASLRRRLRVTWHRALWCSDFPPPARTGSDSPPFQNRNILPVS